MKKIITKLVALSIAMVMLLCMAPAVAMAAAEDNGPVIHLIGDSTVCYYPDYNAPRTGWGQALPDILNDDAAVFDWAISGASTRSFVEGYKNQDGTYSYTERWTGILNSIQEGDYLFIQFGHNDSNELTGKYTYIGAPLDKNSDVSYYYYMNKIITETKAKGGIPIVVSSMERLEPEADVIANGKFTRDSMCGYPAAAEEIAKDNNVTYVDLHKLSVDYYNSLIEAKGVEAGYKAVEKLYLMLDAGVYPNYPNGNRDATHFHYDGALTMAKLVMNDLKRQGHPLAGALREGGVTGSAEYYVNEDFEKLQERQCFAKPMVYDNEYSAGSYWATGVYEEANNKALKFSAVGEIPTSNATRTAYFKLKDASGADTIVGNGLVTMTYDIKFPVYDAEKGEMKALIMLQNSKNSTHHKTQLKSNESGFVIATSNPFEPIAYNGEWMKIKTMMDVSTGKYLTYINGTLADRGIVEKDPLDISAVSLTAIQTGFSNPNNEAYFDNLKVYNATAEDKVQYEEETNRKITDLLDVDFEKAENMPIEGTEEEKSASPWVSFDGENRISFTDTRANYLFNTEGLANYDVVSENNNKYIKMELMAGMDAASNPEIKLPLAETVKEGYLLSQLDVKIPKEYNGANNKAMLYYGITNEDNVRLVYIFFRQVDGKLNMYGYQSQFYSQEAVPTKFETLDLNTGLSSDEFVNVKFLVNLDREAVGIYVNDKWIMDINYYQKAIEGGAKSEAAAVTIGHKRKDDIGFSCMDNLKTTRPTQEEVDALLKTTELKEDFEWTNVETKRFFPDDAEKTEEYVLGGNIATDWYYTYEYRQAGRSNFAIKDGDAEHGKVFESKIIEPANKFLTVRPMDRKYRFSSGYVVGELEYMPTEDHSTIQFGMSNTTAASWNTFYKDPFNLFTLTTSHMQITVTNPFSNAKDYIKLSFKDYLNPDKLDENGNLKKNVWHKVVVVQDLQYRTASVILDGVLIATDVSTNLYKNANKYIKSGGMAFSSCHAEGVVLFDNVTYYSVSAKTAAEMIEAGLDEMFKGGKVGARVNNKRVALPYAGNSGLNPRFDNNYKVVTSDGKSVYETHAGKAVKYTMFNSNSNVTVTDTSVSYVLKADADVSEFNAEKLYDDTYTEKRSYGSNVINVPAGRPAGFDEDIPFSINVTIEKGDTKITKIYNLVVDRPLAPSKSDLFKVGLPLTGYDAETKTAQFKTYIESDKAASVLLVIAIYDESGVLSDIKTAGADIPAGGGAAAYVNWEELEVPENSTFKYMVWTAKGFMPLVSVID